MYAQLCDSTNEIFTSVVVYSRTSKPTKAKNITCSLKMAGIVTFFVGRNNDESIDC